ncbi:thioredoxin family protein [Cohnella cholangitidis]|uniref:Thioredoxin family protein n=1 Tax=Cohnella cholangitidis TaxID=2598458 RepID=A0A7G5C5V8_9BACL|nr:thioredoxin family protein [Cohnella cholangitidis]QMV44592.1 thioredoxin family protein [Cohnella cholangitidis]
MREWDAGDWKREWTFTPTPFALFVHTPLCGTCLAAKRILAVAVEIVPEVQVMSANINVMPDLAQTFQIESVPCLLIKRDNGTWIKQYRFPSVTELVEQLRNERDRS